MHCAIDRGNDEGVLHEPKSPFFDEESFHLGYIQVEELGKSLPRFHEP
jgi:hypothetical protein